MNGQSRQLLDIVAVAAGELGKSVYSEYRVRYCGDRLDKVNLFSPGFGQEVLEYFSPTAEFNTKTVEVVKYVGGGGGSCSCPSREQLCNVESAAGGS